ncbi:MAG: hypothetical protein IJZ38_05770 [Bacteroides sp.]|nr:hypothetical protein [Bacteroides sp.]
MPENRDYDIVQGKLPRKDKYGQDTTGDRLGKGGRHRKDGTYSAVVYDLEIIDPSPAESQITPSHISPRSIEGRSVEYYDLPWWGQVIVKIAEDTIPIILEELSHTAIQSFGKWISNRQNRKNAAKSAKQPSPIKASNLMQKPCPEVNTETNLRLNTSSANPPTSLPITITMPSEFHAAYENYANNMSSEEAQKELLDAFIFYILCLKKLNKITHSKIYDSSGNNIDGHRLVQLATKPEIIAEINHIVQNNPKLLDEWQTVALSDVLERELIHDMHYLPIDDQMLRHKLLDMPVATNNPK